jgi:ferredoxin, 2Fe-2S
MMRVRVRELSGELREIQGTDGWTLMEALRDGGLPIKAECGGCASCATCHVTIAPDWLGALPEPADAERMVLDDLLTRRPESRLACQVELNPGLAGLEVFLTEDCVG